MHSSRRALLSIYLITTALATALVLPAAFGRRAQASECTCKKHQALQKGLFVRLHAKPGAEAELAKFLRDGQKLAEAEGKTPLWFAVQFDAQTFAIFDAFAGEDGRQAHLSGDIAAALMKKAPSLLTGAPVIEKFDVLGQKIHSHP